MAQPLIKFFRVVNIANLQTTQKVQGGLYFETETGILYVYNGSAFEAYSGLKSASFANQKLVLTPSVGSDIEIDLTGYVDSNEFNTELAKYVNKETTIAGIDLKDNITAEELKTALGLNSENLAGQANVLEGVKVNGDDLTVAADKTVNILVAEGSTEGTIAVNGEDIAVHGLGSAAYTASTAYDAAGAAASVKTDLVNGETEFANFKAVGDELRDLDRAAADKVADVKVGETSVVNSERVAVLGTAAGKAIEDFDAAGAAAGALVDAKKYTDETKAAIIGDATTAGDTLGKLEDRIDTIEENNKTYSIAKVESGLGENVKEAYKLVDLDGTQVGETINIYKDSSLISVELVDEKPAEAEGAEATKGQFIKYTYVLATGAESVQYVDVSRLLVEAEFKKGLEVSEAGEVNVKVDAASEAFLTVSQAGVKLSGVQDAIDAAVAAKNVTASGDTYVSATVALGTNHVTVAASESTIASLALADSALQAEDITTGTDNGTIAVEGVNIAVKGLGDAAYVDTTATPTENSTDAFTAGGAYVLDGKIAANTAAINDVKDEVTENAKVTAAALNDLNDRIEAVADSIPTELGVMSVAKGTDGNFVTTTVDNTDAANPKVSVAVSYTESTAAATALATDAYVQEQITASALTWQLF